MELAPRPSPRMAPLARIEDYTQRKPARMILLALTAGLALGRILRTWGRRVRRERAEKNAIRRGAWRFRRT